MQIVFAIFGMAFWVVVLVKVFKSNNPTCRFIQRMFIGAICFAIITAGPLIYMRYVDI
ncbi:hypothetical protein HNP12_004539 [Aeromonas hydrophila]|nr:hypothetical protein [Aeromonas hydrophila]MCS3793668.1 hypothetical protein [Aeromonas hydrophila]